MHERGLSSTDPRPPESPVALRLQAAQVSVVVPFRDRGDLLLQTCASLQQQCLQQWEAILVNDGSQQQTRCLAERMQAEDPRFRLIDVSPVQHEPGPWLARNLGIAAAQAPLVAFLDADDLWHPDKLLAQLQLHRDQPIDLSVTGYLRFRDDKRGPQVVERRTPPAGVHYRQLLAGNVLPLSTVMARRELLLAAAGLDCGPFRPERHEDYGLWLRLFARFPELRYARLAEPLMAYRLHAGSLSARRWRSHEAVAALLAQHSRHRLEHGLLMAGWIYQRLRERRPRRNRLGHIEPLPAVYAAMMTNRAIFAQPGQEQHPPDRAFSRETAMRAGRSDLYSVDCLQ